MGNCCKVQKKRKEARKASVDSLTMVTDERSQRSNVLMIVCSEPLIRLTVAYRPTIPIQDIKEQVLSEFPSIDFTKYSLFRDDFQILDATATLLQLGITQGDILNIKSIEEHEEETSEDIVASENASESELKTENLKQEITGITVKKALIARISQEFTGTSPRKHAQELWRTALPSPPAHALINCDIIDNSSFTNNTHEHSLRPPEYTFSTKIPVQKESGSSKDSSFKEKPEETGLTELKYPFFIFL